MLDKVDLIVGGAGLFMAGVWTGCALMANYSRWIDRWIAPVICYGTPLLLLFGLVWVARMARCL